MKRRGFFGKMAGALAVVTGSAVPVMAKKVKGPEWTGMNVIGYTLLENYVIPGDGEWHETPIVFPFTKYLEKSTIYFHCFGNIQQSINADVGHYFKIRFKDSDGNYPMPDLLTGQTTHSANSPYPFVISDTIWHQQLNKNPLMGDYTIELFALAGAGEMTMPSTMTTLVIMECPHLKRAGEPVY